MNITPARVDWNLALHDDRDVHLAVTEAALAPVVDRSRAEQRAPAALDGVDHRLARRGCSGTLSFIPANEAEAVSSAVADERTATGSSESSAPTSWSYASEIAAASQSGISLSFTAWRAPLGGLLQRRGVLDVEPVEQLGRAARPARFRTRKAAYAGAPTTKPGGTGSPAWLSWPRLAPLPPA